jgi:hypothetical protein
MAILNQPSINGNFSRANGSHGTLLTQKASALPFLGYLKHN